MGYDTGFRIGGSDGRPVEPAVVRHELEIIRDDLHCNAVRLIGNDLDRMEIAALSLPLGGALDDIEDST
jgi:hypothetical protein